MNDKSLRKNHQSKTVSKEAIVPGAGLIKPAPNRLSQKNLGSFKDSKLSKEMIITSSG